MRPHCQTFAPRPLPVRPPRPANLCGRGRHRPAVRILDRPPAGPEEHQPRPAPRLQHRRPPRNLQPRLPPIRRHRHGRCRPDPADGRRPTRPRKGLHANDVYYGRRTCDTGAAEVLQAPRRLTTTTSAHAELSASGRVVEDAIVRRGRCWIVHRPNASPKSAQRSVSVSAFSASISARTTSGEGGEYRLWCPRCGTQNFVLVHASSPQDG